MAEQDRERCLKSLTWAIEQLEGKADPKQLEKIANLIIQTMTGPWRFFHTPEHIFEVGGDENAVEVLAALFHDLVYVQVDQGVSVNISCYISAFVKEESHQLIIREQAELRPDRMFELIMAIFGFSPAQALSPMAGQNEFLSAVIAAKALEHMLPTSAIAEVAACIEATIPFRPKSEDGVSACDRLYERLRTTNSTFELGWSDDKVIEVIKRAVRVANRDVENFASPSSAHFLDNTWNLLPETNHHLATPNSYTVHGYRTSLQKMEGFMNFLKPEIVFQQFGEEPASETYQRLIDNTRRNLEAAKLYLGAKLVSIAIIEALSFRIGRDIPISTMMGELPSPEYSTPQLEHFIPEVTQHHSLNTDLEREVLELLEKGRSSDSSYDVKNSPIATYVVKLVGFSEVRQLIEHAKDFFKGNITAEDFLALCNPDVVKAVTHGVIQLFRSREVALSEPNRVLV
ncbi:hypothetical protein H6G89_22690 [Oscillatoria sp. FACHB-1407]|uniref:hypothetical protein n=1 Tax=Oscillatoria sp. FACHB-1407 TaxID=2692847 RepID=UPI001683264A|nr:hypothetical protein [Oscillatoria sp. FACHB-1407]MBD2463813.1 hypothetical protein [Oscillatoria sp. FACHB-1407]